MGISTFLLLGDVLYMKVKDVVSKVFTGIHLPNLFLYLHCSLSYRGNRKVNTGVERVLHGQ